MDSITRPPLDDSLAKQSVSGPAKASSTMPQAKSQAGGCVHFEHARPVGSKNAKDEPRTATQSAAMSSYRLLICLSILGWSERDLARRTGRHQTSVVRWAKGLSPIPGEEAAWLETLAAFHMAHPAPCARVETNATGSASSRFLIHRRK